MTEHRTERRTGTPSAGVDGRTPSTYPAASQATGWVGWVLFAGAMMVLIGTFHVIQGLVAVFNDEYFLVTDNGLLVELDYTVWGWTHIVAGVIVVVAGLGVFTGQVWARVVGVALAVLSAVLNITFLAAYPVWSAIVIALDVFVIFALTVHGGEMRTARGDETRVPRQHSR